jgi:hypothetical protein
MMTSESRKGEDCDNSGEKRNLNDVLETIPLGMFVAAAVISNCIACMGLYGNVPCPDCICVLCAPVFFPASVSPFSVMSWCNVDVPSLFIILIVIVIIIQAGSTGDCS